jgi:hypothetical protein
MKTKETNKKNAKNKIKTCNKKIIIITIILITIITIITISLTFQLQKTIKYIFKITKKDQSISEIKTQKTEKEKKLFKYITTIIKKNKIKELKNILEYEPKEFVIKSISENKIENSHLIFKIISLNRTKMFALLVNYQKEILSAKNFFNENVLIHCIKTNNKMIVSSILDENRNIRELTREVSEMEGCSSILCAIKFNNYEMVYLFIQKMGRRKMKEYFEKNKKIENEYFVKYVVKKNYFEIFNILLSDFEFMYLFEKKFILFYFIEKFKNNYLSLYLDKFINTDYFIRFLVRYNVSLIDHSIKMNNLYSLKLFQKIIHFDH